MIKLSNFSQFFPPRPPAASDFSAAQVSTEALQTCTFYEPFLPSPPHWPPPSQPASTCRCCSSVPSQTSPVLTVPSPLFSPRILLLVQLSARASDLWDCSLDLQPWSLSAPPDLYFQDFVGQLQTDIPLTSFSAYSTSSSSLVTLHQQDLQVL